MIVWKRVTGHFGGAIKLAIQSHSPKVSSLRVAPLRRIVDNPHWPMIEMEQRGLSERLIMNAKTKKSSTTLYFGLPVWKLSTGWRLVVSSAFPGKTRL